MMCELRFRQISRRGKRRIAVEHALEAVFIDRLLPFRDGDGRDSIADEIGRRQRLRHQAMDSEHQRHTRDRYGPGCRKRRRQHDKGCARDAGRAFGGKEKYQEQRDLLLQIERRVGRLGQEDAGGGEIKAGAVEIE